MKEVMRFVVLFLTLLAGLSVQADELDAVKKNIRAGLDTLSADISIDRIQPAAIDGLYEVVIGTDVIYATADGRYILRGELLDLEQQQNVTQQTRSAMRREMLARMPKQDMIRFSNGKAEHAIYVFTDVDCGYCRKLHQDVPYLTEHGVEVRYLAYPRAGLDSDTFNEMEDVWCSKDRKAALTAAKSDKKVDAPSCDNPVAAQYKAGQAMGIRGTPAIFLENGRELPGYVPPKELLSILNRGG